jgi:iron complex outermembrane receptor protein
MHKSQDSFRSALLAGAVFCAITSVPSAAQQTETVVVTGSLIQGNTNLVSPVTVIDQTTLDQRGISSIQDALQQTLANNGPAVNNNWTANGNFAQGASGISLRGLTTNSTLVLFDGMRAAYYPLADDGIRNFVDLNTIPDDIVENIQVLRDGASSAYGADAIAGVVNIITKREFQGISGRAEGGIADRGDAGSFRFSLTAGTGDLSKDHVNFYLSASYYHSDILYAKSRPYPYNSYDLTNVCYQGNCGSNNTLNAVQADGSFAGISTSGEFAVRPYNFDPVANRITTPLAGSRWQNESGCAWGTPVNLTVTQQGAAAPPTVCNYDYYKHAGTIQPAVTRFGLTGHTAFALPAGIEGAVEANFMQDSVSYPYYLASTLRGNAPAGIDFPPFSTSTNDQITHAKGSLLLFLPAFVCPERTNCATAADRTPNPNNPFPATYTTPVLDPITGLPVIDPTTGLPEVTTHNQAAGIIGRDWYAPLPFNETRDRTYRVAANLNGSLLDDWKWNVGMTAMHIDLHQDDSGYAYIQHFLDVVNDGTFNFIDPTQNNKPLAALNGQTVNQYVFPHDITNMTSDEAEATVSVTAPIYKLPGGDLTVVVGGDVRYEAIDDPSANSDAGGPTQRYFVLNAFGTKGSRDVYSGYFEINAPILEELVLNVSGRYDSYSSGQSNFSPKIGVWAKPLDWITLKGTYSEGFRIPSFAEANALPTTGYVSNNKSLFNDAFLAQYGCSLATYTSCPAYVTQGSYGLTTIANTHLNPEKSRSWVLDVTVQPTDELTITTTYYNIKKTAAIAQLDCSAALTNYYTNQPLPPNCTIIPDSPDPNHATAQPIVGFLYAPFVNANSIRTSGFDFSMTYDSDLTAAEDLIGVTEDLGPVHLTTSAQATFIQNLDTKFPDGSIQRYDGTLGNFNLTAGTGTPKWKGAWQTTFSGGIYEFTSTLNWVSGYNVSAMDQGNGYRDCGLSDGTRPCRTADYFTWDINTQARATDNITVYFTVLNLLDNLPPVDTVATYGITNYNVVTSGDGLLGRYLKMGIKLDY